MKDLRLTSDHQINCQGTFLCCLHVDAFAPLIRAQHNVLYRLACSAHCRWLAPGSVSLDSILPLPKPSTRPNKSALLTSISQLSQEEEDCGGRISTGC